MEARTGDLVWTDSDPSGTDGLIMVHSLGTDSSMWAPQVGPLSVIRRVVAIDLPGHGASSAAPGEYRLEDLGHDVLDVAGEAGLERFDVCGISIGGIMALWLAINAPERVRTLIVANSAARVGTEEGWAERIQAVEAGGMAAVGHVVDRFFAVDRPMTRRAIRQVFLAVDPTGYIGCCAALRDTDLRGELSAIECPTFIIAGDEDVSTPPTEAHRLHAEIRGSRLHVIPGAAHLSNLDQPTAFLDHVREGLS